MAPTRISQLNTQSSDLVNTPDAHARLFDRYQDAVRRYFLACTQSPVAADELMSDFALRLLDGRLSRFQYGAGPYGRFRDYLKGQLRYLIQERRRNRPVESTSAALDELPGNDDCEQQFEEAYRTTAIRHVIAEMQQDGDAGRRYATLIQLRFQHPTATYDELSTLWKEESLTGCALKNQAPRAKGMFNSLLRKEIAEHLGTNDDLAIDDELKNLRLWAIAVDEALFPGE